VQIFLPLPQTGFRAMRAGLLTDTYLQVHQIRMMKERFQKTTFAPEQYALVQRLSSASLCAPTRAQFVLLARGIRRSQLVALCNELLMRR